MKACLLALSLLLLLCAPSVAQPTNDAGLAMWLLSQTKEEENSAVSPFSLQTAFAMLATGARGATQTEILQGLVLGQDYLSAVGRELAELAKDGTEIAIANRLWPARGVTIEAAFLTTCREVFGAQPEPLDYGQTEKARRTINQWIKAQTREKIPELLAEGFLDRGTVLVMTNAVYFKGSWAESFDKALTTPSLFAGPKGEVQVPMMRRLGSYGFWQDGAVQVVRLGYKDSNLAMFVLVPRARDGWKALRKGLDQATLQSIMDSDLENAKVDFSMPRFQARGRLDVIPAMQSLGIRKVFGGGADLSGIGPGLAVDDAVHEAVVEVNEEGTVAAAATAISTSRSLPSVHRVVADRPFLFLIGDTSSGVVLFAGQVVDPEHAE